MPEKTLEQWQYPIGRFESKEEYSEGETQTAITYLLDFPLSLREEISKCTDEDLKTPYRSGGWTIRQLIHHIADSHMHAYTRCKFAYLENHPLIKNYHEKDWAERSPEVSITPIEASLSIIEGIYARWGDFFTQLTPEDFNRTFLHPEREVPFSLAEVSCFYAWHAAHHLAHIQNYLLNKS